MNCPGFLMSHTQNRVKWKILRFVDMYVCMCVHVYECLFACVCMCVWMWVMIKAIVDTVTVEP